LRASCRLFCLYECGKLSKCQSPTKLIVCESYARRQIFVQANHFSATGNIKQADCDPHLSLHCGVGCFEHV